jgi:hypothetical protein
LLQTLSKKSGKNDAFRKFEQMSQNWLTLGKISAILGRWAAKKDKILK